MNIICKASLKTILGIMVLWSFVSSAIATNDTTHNWKLVITNEEGSMVGGTDGPKIP